MFVGIYISWMSKEFYITAQDEFVKDEDAFIFNIRSSKGYMPKISYVKKEDSSRALRHSNDPAGYLIFGDLSLYIHEDDTVFANSRWCHHYDPFPNQFIFGIYQFS